MIIRHLVNDKRQIHPHSLAISPSAVAALRQRDVVVAHACGNRVSFCLLLRFRHQV